MLTFGHLMVLENSKSHKLKILYKEVPESLSIWEKIILTSLISLTSSISSTSILTLLTSPLPLTEKLSILSKPSGPETENKSLKKNIKSSTNSCSLVITINIECTSNLMFHWPSRLWSMSLKPMMKSLVFNLRKVVSVCILKRFSLKKIVNKFYFLTSWDSLEVSLTVKISHSTFQDKIIKTQL